MPLSPDRFYKGSTQFRCADGTVELATVYSYETHNALYNVLIIRGGKFYRLNCGPLSNLISAIRPIHYEIERKFGI